MKLFFKQPLNLKNLSSALFSRKGVALITVVSLMSLLTVLVTFFFLMVQDDRNRARNFLDAMRARLMLETAAQEAMAKIMDGFDDPEMTPDSDGKRRASVVATPGLMEVRYFDIKPWRDNLKQGVDAFGDSSVPTWPSDPDNNTETPYYRNPFLPSYDRKKANPRWIPLFSWRAFAPGIRYLEVPAGAGSTGARAVPNPDYNPAAVFNLNTIQNPFYPGELYLSGSPDLTMAFSTARVEGVPKEQQEASRDNVDNFRFGPGESSLDRPLYVQWIPILENPALPPGPTNRVVGRYAYWVDVENSKVNLTTSRRNYDESKIRALTGDSDAEDNVNVPANPKSYFLQDAPAGGGVGKSREGRAKIEKTLMAGANAAGTIGVGVAFGDQETFVRYDRNVEGGDQIDNAAAHIYYRTWMGWDDNGRERPYAADHSMVHWRTFTGVRPLSASNVSIEHLSEQYANSADSEGYLNTWSEFQSFIDPKTQTSAEQGRKILQTYRRGHGVSTTIYGRDEERDILGRERISIVEFQRSVTDVNDIVSGDPLGVMTRLTDPDYYRALHPAAHLTTNKDKSLADSLALFGGQGKENESIGGELVLRQMLLNVVESSRPFTSPPLQDLKKGFIGAKSMPYVAEVATRVRSAVITLPTNLWLTFEDFTNTFVEVRTNTNGDSEYRLKDTSIANIDGQSLEAREWLRHVTADVSMGLINPNPFTTNVFSGSHQLEIVLDYRAPQTIGGGLHAQTSQTDIPEVGYQALPIPVTGKADRPYGPAYGVAAMGPVIQFPRLMDNKMLVVSAATLTNTGMSSADIDDKNPLRIRGWTIRKKSSGEIFHQVPLRYPWSASLPGWPDPVDAVVLSPSLKNLRYWYQMADWDGNPNSFRNNPGHPNADYSGNLRAFQENGIKVGWITQEAYNKKKWASLFITNNDASAFDGTWLSTNNAIWTNIEANLASIHNGLTNEDGSGVLLERVQSMDPTLGHRTGNPFLTITNVYGTEKLVGHFYGAMGHSWRHARWPDSGGSPELKDVKVVTGYTYTTNTSTTMVRVPRGVSFELVPVTVSNVVSTPVYDTVTQLVFPQTASAHTLGLCDRMLNPKMGLPFSGEGPNGVAQNVMRGAQLNAPLLGMGGEGTSSADREFDSGSAKGLSVKFTWPLDPSASGSTKPYITFTFQASGGAGLDERNYMVNIGELGFIHSGMLGLPILFDERSPESRLSINNPYLGPPLTLLLDIFTPGAFVNNETGELLTRSQWESGTHKNSPATPRRGTWNINSAIAQDNYNAIRAGAAEHRKNDISSMPTRVAYQPTAQAGRFRRVASKGGLYRLPDFIPLDVFLSPYLNFRRGAESWLGVVGGDVTPGNYLGHGAFGVEGFATSPGGSRPASAFTILQRGEFTWNPGVGAADEPEPDVFVQFDPEGPTVLNQLLHLGRENQEGNNESTGKNNFEKNPAGGFRPANSSDFGLNAAGELFRDESKRRLPMSSVDRFSAFELSHFAGERLSQLIGLSTMLNPSRITPAPKWGIFKGEKAKNKNFPGAYGRRGIFRNAPIALTANQWTTSANAFTIHVVAQAIRDNPASKRLNPDNSPGINTGLGYMDANDEVTAEQWGQIVFTKYDPEFANKHKAALGLSEDTDDNVYRVLYYRVLDNPK